MQDLLLKLLRLLEQSSKLRKIGRGYVIHSGKTKKKK